MDRTRLALVSVVVLAVTGGALAATTFESAGFSGGDENASGSGDSSAGGTGTTVLDLFGAVAYLLLAGLVIWIVAVLAIAIREGVLGPRRAFVIVVAIVAVGALALTYSAEQESAALDQLEGPAGNDSADGTEPPREEGTVQGPPSTAPTGTILAVLAGLALVGGLSVLVFTRGDSGATGPEPVPDETDAEAVARVAGETADRIEETTLSNAVYRAWRDMTDALDVPGPETTTPADFADHAIAAGIDERDARALTDLFREVRYGDAEATPEREEQAGDLLRRIEASYADGAGDADGDRAAVEDIETDTDGDGGT